MKNHRSIRFVKLTLASVLLGASLAQAHSVWIEDNPEKQLVVRFGELNGEVEQSPGHLDSLSLPIAWKTSEDGKPVAFVVEKKSDHFLFVSAEPTTNAFGETVFPVMKRGDRPASWPHFYARWQAAGAPAPTKPSLTLNILPTAAAGEFQVFFRGQPLPNAVITVHSQSKEDEIKADAEGRFKFTAPAGIALLTSNYKEQVKGFAGGAAYDVTSHNTALSWRQP